MAVLSTSTMLTVSASTQGQESAKSSIATSVKSEFATYTDTDSVTVVSPSVSASVHDPLSGWTAGGSYLVDIVSAASVDIVSTASGRWTEVRHAGTVHGEYKPADLGVSAVGSVSREPDYLSLTGGGGVRMDLSDKNITPQLTYTFGHDTAGRSGTPFSVYSLELDRHSLNATLGLVLDRETVLDFSGDAVFEIGHQEKPYRYIPLFAPNVAPQVPVGASVSVVNALRLPGRTAERLPTTRQRYAVSARLGQRLADTTLIASERLYTDSWGQKASTTDMRLVFDLSRRLYVWPQLRAHLQTGVSFWQLAYVGGIALDGSLNVPDLRTGDRELGPLSAGSGGLGARWNVGPAVDPSALGLNFLVEGTVTHYSEALFIDQRLALFGALQLEAAF